MGYPLSPEDRAFFEALPAKAEPYTEEDPEWYTLDGDEDPDRMIAAIAKGFLEGRLR